MLRRSFLQAAGLACLSPLISRATPLEQLGAVQIFAPSDAGEALLELSRNDACWPRAVRSPLVIGVGDQASAAASSGVACALIEPDAAALSKLAPGRAALVIAPVRPAGLPPEVEVQLAPDGLEAVLRTDDPAQKSLRRFVFAQGDSERVGLPGVSFVPSPNWGMRSLGGGIDTVVVHATVINTMEGTQRAFLDDKVRRVSAHYVVDRDGSIVQMVDERVAAWHAGVSELGARTGVNDFSVGVELVNLNDGEDPYPDRQYLALARIIQDLRTRHDVPDSHIVSHAQIARPLGRKSDPLGFDFGRLRRLVKGTPGWLRR